MENLGAKTTMWAAENGLNSAQFGTCISNPVTDAEVTASLQEGLSLGINSTPTSYLNGFKLEGTVQWEVLQQVIVMELNRLGSPIAGVR